MTQQAWPGGPPPDEAPEGTTGDARLARVEHLAQAYLDLQYEVLIAGERELRDGTLDVVHRTRVATRRYRSVVREVRRLLESSSATVLDEGLRWYARLLGDVRDVQVLSDTLDREMGALPDETVTDVARAQTRAYTARRLEQAAERLQQGLQRRRYVKLVDLADQWHRGMPFLDDLHPSSAEAMIFLDRAERRFERRLDAAVAAGQPDDLMHDARKSAKRARYVAEMAAPVLPRRADETIRRMTSFQDDIGTWQDGVVARQALAELAAAPDAEHTGTAGVFQRLSERLEQRSVPGH